MVSNSHLPYGYQTLSYVLKLAEFRVEKSGLLVFLRPDIFKMEGYRQLDLDLVHGVDITRLDKVLKLFNLLTQLLNGNLVIFNSAHNLRKCE